MPTVLHILPHPGGGAETFIDVLEGMHGYRHERRALSSTRSPAPALLSIAAGWPGLARTASRHDLLTSHGDVAGMLSTPLLRRRPSVAVIQGLHLVRRTRGARGAAARCGLRTLVASADRTVCSSDAELAEVASVVGPDACRKLVVVPNGVPLPASPPEAERAALRRELDLSDDAVVGLYLGQLEERKDPLTAVRAAEAIHGVGYPFVLLVAGDGPLRGEVEAHAGEPVRVLGYRRDADRLLGAADVFVLPSAREGLSFALLEAMGNGLATVVSDGAGNPEAVGAAGIVVPFGDADALAAVFRRLTTDRQERERLATAARERVRTRFSADSLRGGMAAIYEDVLATAGY